MHLRDHHDHDGGLFHDLRLMQRKLAERRQALRLLGVVASLMIAGGGGLLTPRRAAAGSACVADAPETAGPYPADGTNMAGGETSDVLTESGVLRKDIRRSFLSTTTKAKGVPVRMHLTLVNTKSACMPLPGFVVYLWHCDRDGGYSLYTVPQESYLRGVQAADDSARLEFVTVFPGCYPGRFPHMHLEIFESLDQATIGTNAVFTTQFVMPAETCAEVYDTKGYEGAKANFANVSLETDGVFRDDTKRQLNAMTPTFKGNPADGYAAKVTVGMPL